MKYLSDFKSKNTYSKLERTNIIQLYIIVNLNSIELNHSIKFIVYEKDYKFQFMGR